MFAIRVQDKCKPLQLLLSFTTLANGSDNAPKLEGTRWIFEANSLVDIWAEPIGDTLLTLEFHDGHFNGFAGCNSFLVPTRRKETNFPSIR